MLRLVPPSRGGLKIVLIFVDDGLVCSNRKDILTDIIDYLRTNFEIQAFSSDIRAEFLLSHLIDFVLQLPNNPRLFSTNQIICDAIDLEKSSNSDGDFLLF